MFLFCFIYYFCNSTRNWTVMMLMTGGDYDDDDDRDNGDVSLVNTLYDW